MKKRQKTYSVLVTRKTITNVVVEVEAQNEAAAAVYAVNKANSSEYEDKWDFDEYVETEIVK